MHHSLHRRTSPRSRTLHAWLVLVVMLAVSQQGCINSFVMLGKVLMGDPLQPSAFEMQTGISLKDSQSRILVYCTAPSFISSDYGSLTTDVQEELTRRMKRRKLQVVSADVAADLLDSQGGNFDPNVVARGVDDVDYIVKIEIDQFSYMEESSPNLYRGFAHGTILIHEVRDDGGGRHAVQVLSQEFTTQYPNSHPVAVDQTPKNVFIRRFIDHLADTLGTSFYEVRSSDLFAM